MKEKLLYHLEGLKLRLFGNPLAGLMTGETMRKIQLQYNRPNVGDLKQALKRYHETKDEEYNSKAVMILLRFRIVMTDYRFEKLLKDIRVTKETAVIAMASVLNFIPAEKGETTWPNVKM